MKRPESCGEAGTRLREGRACDEANIHEEPDMKFMLMMHAKRGGGDWEISKWPLDDIKAHIGFMKRFAKELNDNGELVAAEGLAMPDQARVVRAGRGGDPEITDGPFPEAKEFLAGYW